MPPSPAPSLEERKRLISLQEKIASEIVFEDRFSEGVVAGVDQAFISRKDGREMVISGAVAFDSTLRPLSKSWAILDTTFPYVPGLLSFREGPTALEAVKRLETRPTILFVDGCGINHPRRAGLASHIGVTLNVPTIGVSKNVLCGTFDPPGRVGDASPLVYVGERVGYVLFSKKRCRPIVVAPGHKVSVDGALDLARRYLRDNKLPEPCFAAHQQANLVKRQILSGEVSF
ncbi:MAG TPA: endonuclease V [Methanotrichaceae archaeon]|nr:endonuclease V [Methanotrichaceae archaeon]